jgi:hypothetical protein
MPLSDRLWLALRAAPAISLGDAFWYGLMAGLAWFAFYVLLRRTMAGRKIVPRIPTLKQYEQRFAAVTADRGASGEVARSGM